MITAEQKLARANRIGSSDAPAILGLDPYRSAADVWLTKTGRAGDFEGNDATDTGNRLEPVLLEFACEKAGIRTIRVNFNIEHPSGLLLANLDGISGDRTEIIEAKTTRVAEGWGEPGTDEVPDRVQAQVAHQFACCPTARIAWVPVLLANHGFDWRLYRIERNDALVHAVERAGIEFMQRYVLPDVQPSDFRPSPDVVARIKRIPGHMVDVPDGLVAEYLAAKSACDEVKDREKAMKDAKNALIAALGQAEGGRWSGGTLTYMPVKRKGYTVEPSEYRQLKFQK